MRFHALQKQKASLEQQKKEWELAVQKASLAEDIKQLEKLISAVPFEILSPHVRTDNRRISAFLRIILKNKFASLVPLLIEKIKNPAWWELALQMNPEEENLILSFFQHCPDPLAFLKSCQSSLLNQISLLHE